MAPSKDFNEAQGSLFIRDVVIIILIAYALAATVFIAVYKQPQLTDCRQALCDVKFGEGYTPLLINGRDIICTPDTTIGNTGISITKSGGKLHD